MDSDPRVAPTLQHRGSTKQLIRRFELMNTSPPGKSKSTHVYPEKHHVLPPRRVSTISQKKAKLPIKQSFRNLFAAFKKIATGTQNETPASSSSVISGLELPSPSRPKNRVSSGSLLYLLHPSCPPGALASPCWIPCIASLEDDRITIAPTTAQKDFVIHTIYLAHCTDIRSLTVQQLDAIERNSLQQRQRVGEIRLFEILFEGRAREKFAATSVRDRAGWVSAIWDAILPSQELNRVDDRINLTPIELEGVHEISDNPSSLRDTKNIQCPDQTINLFGTHMERTLPSLPSDGGNKHEIKLPLVTPGDLLKPYSPVSPSIYPPSRTVSQMSPKEISPRSKNVSMMNLERLSVVQQRLAQMELNVSAEQSSSYGLRSPTSLFRVPSPFCQANSSCNNTGSKQSKSAGSVKLDTVNHTPNIDVYARQSLSDTSVAKDMNHSQKPELARYHAQSLRPTHDEITSHFESLAEVLRDHAARNYDQTANLGDQIVSLQDEVQRLPQELANVVSGRFTSADIHKTILNIDAKIEANTDALGAINKKLGMIEKDVLTSKNIDKIHQSLQDIGQRLNENVSIISQKLEVMQKGQEQHLNIVSSKNSSAPPSTSLPELLEIREKLDVLTTLRTQSIAGEVEEGSSPQHLPNIQTVELANIKALLEESKCQGALRGQQQVESVRYLNELNTWLEMFVNNGMSQIYNISLNTERLSQYLGCRLQEPNDITNESSDFLTTINQSLVDIQAKNPVLGALRVSIDGLLVILNEHQKSFNMANIVNLIDRQHQDQERLFRTLTDKISDDIKGERLRFVEAMKEATAINVQIHVEQFKAELSREVSGMTEQVGRLHRERQAMEAQIADLFAFYTKQKEAVGSFPTEHGVRELQPPERRPLPNPKRF